MRIFEVFFLSLYHILNASAGICWSLAEILKEFRLFIEGKESDTEKKDG